MRVPQQGDDPGDHQDVEQCFRHDEVFDVHLVGVQEHRRRRECRDARRDTAVREKRVEDKPERHTEGVLNGGYHPQFAGPGQRVQHDRVTRGPDRIRREVPGELEIGVGVAGKFKSGPVSDHREHP